MKYLDKWNKQKKNEQNKRYIILAAVALVVIIAISVLMNLFSSNRSVSASRLRCVAAQSVTPFGNYVVYYDGVTLFCLDTKGNEKWNYTLGSNASFTCSSNHVVAWSGSQLHILDKSGQPTYNETLENTIQFAKAGAKYVAIVMGTDVGPKLEIKDLWGTHVDDEEPAYADMIILDLGFFDNGEYLWTTSLDVHGTVANTILHTYKVNMTSSGEISLGENLAYDVVFAGGELNVVTTRKLRKFDYRGTENTQASTLVYGWQLEDHDTVGSDAMLLFSLSGANNTSELNQLRLLYGKTDKRFTLPSTCAGAALYNKRLYAFSAETIYRATVNAQRFEAIALPGIMNGQKVTNFLGMLDNGTAILATGDGSVYSVTLP